MKVKINSMSRSTIVIKTIVLLTLCLIMLILCWESLAFLRTVIPIQNHAPERFPITDIIYSRSSGLGFINADGTGNVTFLFFLKSRTIFSNTGRPLITGDGQALIITDSNKPDVGNIFIAHPGKTAIECNWWGYARLASDGKHVLVEKINEGLKEYSLDDCGTTNPPRRIFNGVFGSLSPDEQYYAYHKPSTEISSNKANVHIVNIETWDEKIVGEGIAPSWSPDGQWLAYTGRDGIYIFATMPYSEPRRLVEIKNSITNFGKPIYSYGPADSYYPPIVSWSPDSQWLVYHIYNENLKNNREFQIHFIPPYSIFKVNVMSGNTIKIVDGGLSPYWRLPIKQE